MATIREMLLPSTIIEPRSMVIHAIVAAATGTAIASAHWTADRSAVDVERIVRLPVGLDPAVAWVEATFPAFPSLGADQAVLDTGAGIGQALRERLFATGRGRGWRFFDLRGRDRQVLSNALMVAMSSRRIHVTDHGHEDAVRRALADLRKSVDEDGVVGAELTTALALTAWARPTGLARIW